MAQVVKAEDHYFDVFLQECIRPNPPDVVTNLLGKKAQAAIRDYKEGQQQADDYYEATRLIVGFLIFAGLIAAGATAKGLVARGWGFVGSAGLVGLGVIVFCASRIFGPPPTEEYIQMHDTYKPDLRRSEAFTKFCEAIEAREIVIAYSAPAILLHRDR